MVRHGEDGALAAQVLMLTLDGVPLFYNGMEVGDATESADPALFEKMPVFWRPSGRAPLRDIYRDLIKLRKQHPAFTNGDVDWLGNSVPGEVLTFLRRDATDEYLIVLNFSSRNVAGSIELPDVKGFELVKINGWTNPVHILLPEFHLGGYGWVIFHRTVAK